jgi:C-terminal binding-module, SLH-like, of glucodextranase
MLTLAVIALLTLTDPVSDIGDGTVRPPTAAISRPIGALDVTQLEFYNTETITFSLTFASLTNPFELSNGFTFPVIEVYVDDYSNTGSTILLPGSGMRLPGGVNWKYAFKLTGDTLQLFETTANGWQEVSSKYSTNISIQGNSIVVSSSLPYPEKFDAYGMVGSYTPFNETGWMPMSRATSPWAYSSDTQTFPVLDVIAPSFEAQRNALASGVLPVIKPPRPTNPWIFVMIGGILLALIGVMLRFAPNRKAEARPTASKVTELATAQPGPYQPEPLKSNLPRRSTTLQNLTEDTEATPGQLMAAERARAMIVADRLASGQTPVNDEHSSDMGLESETDTTSDMIEESTADVDTPDTSAREEVTTLEDTNATEVEERVVSSAAIPLFQAPKIPVTPPVIPQSSRPQTSNQQISKADFGASGLESWNDYDDELANFNWVKSGNTVNLKAELDKAKSEEQNPDTNS